MDKTNETTSRFDAQDDIIELGVASVDTHGTGPEGEGFGIPILPGILKD